MACRRCSDCGINFPSLAAYVKCERCGETTDWMGSEAEDPDWRERAAASVGSPDGLVHTESKTVQWRWGEFVRLGFSPETAQSLALIRDAELRDIERWLEQGATLEQVLEIVSPL